MTPSVTEQLAADAQRESVSNQMKGNPWARKFAGAWEQWLLKVAGPARAAKILERKVCGVCQGKLVIKRVYSRSSKSVPEWTCAKCGRTAAPVHVA